MTNVELVTQGREIRSKHRIHHRLLGIHEAPRGHTVGRADSSVPPAAGRRSWGSAWPGSSALAQMIHVKVFSVRSNGGGAMLG